MTADELVAEVVFMRDRGSREDQVKLLDLVSHDLKNPLAVIELSTAALLDAQAAPSGERRLRSARNLGRLQRAAARMSHLVDDLLNVAGIEAGNFTLDARALELPALAAEAADSLRPQAAAKAVALEVALPANLPPISADPVVLLSGAGDVKGSASELGTAAYVDKPFELETLLGVVRRQRPLPRSARAPRTAAR